jgi:hypothetical protein
MPPQAASRAAAAGTHSAVRPWLIWHLILHPAQDKAGDSIEMHAACHLHSPAANAWRRARLPSLSCTPAPYTHPAALPTAGSLGGPLHSGVEAAAVKHDSDQSL